MTRAAVRPLLLAFVSLAGCLFPGGEDDDPDAPAPSADEAVQALRWKLDLEPELGALAGGRCEVTIAEGTVRVRLTPGARGRPGPEVLRRMSARIQDVTWIPPERHVIRTAQGRLLFVHGAPAP